MKADSKSLLSLAFTCSVLCSMPGAYGALLYHWDFDSADGTNTGTVAGGDLTLDVGITAGPTGYPSGSFTATGVSGDAGDKAFNANNAFDGYWGGNSYSPITNAAAVSSIDLTGLGQFTITMWVQRAGSRNVDLLNIGSTTTPGQTSNAGISIGLDGNWSNGVRVGVNGSTSYTGDLWSAGTDNDWVFLAFAYTATEWNWWSPAFGDIYFGGADQPGNGAVLVGDATTSVTVAQGVHLGGAADGPGPLALGSSATAFLANDGANTLGTTNGFNGNLDDIRIYNSLLSVSEIEAVRLAAVPEPSSASALGALGVFALLRRRRF